MTNHEDPRLSGLSEGVPGMPRRITSRERRADQIYLFLQFGSSVLFIVSAILGYAWKGLLGLPILAIIGFVLGWWIRRSLGIRGPDQTIGFFRRKCERARGSRRGVLEWLIETIRGNEFTVAKCKAICSAFEHAMRQMQDTADEDAQRRILEDLDRTTKEISYD